MSEAIFFGREEAARRAGVSLDTIRRAINAGALPAKRTSINEDGAPSGKYLISEEALHQWFNGLVDA